MLLEGREEAYKIISRSQSQTNLNERVLNNNRLIQSKNFKPNHLMYGKRSSQTVNKYYIQEKVEREERKQKKFRTNPQSKRSSQTQMLMH